MGSTDDNVVEMGYCADDNFVKINPAPDKLGNFLGVIRCGAETWLHLSILVVKAPTFIGIPKDFKCLPWPTPSYLYYFIQFEMWLWLLHFLQS